MRTDTVSPVLIRRHLLLFSLTLACLCASTVRVSADERPNILFAFADDWGRYASAYAELEPGGISDLVSTPNFDRVAKEGVLFRNAFVNAPSCTPCRSSILSGQYFWRTGRGAILQGAVWDSQIPTFPLLLEQAGYQVGFTAKVWSPGTPANAPIGAGRNAVPSAGGRFNQFSQNLGRANNPDQAKQELINEVGTNFRKFLDSRSTDKPFLYWWGPTNTHRRWIRGSGLKYWQINPDDLTGHLSAHWPDVPEVREDMADYLGEVQAVDAGLGALLQVLDDEKLRENTLIIVSGDHGVPGMPSGKCNLYDLGTAVPLVISWPRAIPGGRVISDFVSLPDLAPTVLEFAGAPVPSVMTGRSLLSILKSDRAGQVDPGRDAVLIGRERHVAAARTEQRPYPQRALRTKDFLYIHNFTPDRWPMGVAPGFGLPDAAMPGVEELGRNTFAAFGDLDASPTKAWIVSNGLQSKEYRKYFDIAFAQRPQEELYDLMQDPEQLHNVAAHPDYQQQREQLRQRLMDTLRETGDPRVTETPVPYEHPPFTEMFRRGGDAGNRKR